MRNAIAEYIDIPEKIKKELWKNAVFVFDTNILLNLYRYTDKSRKDLLDSMKNLRERIWIPYQIAYEFMKNRPEIIFETERRYESLKKDGESFINKLSNNLRLPCDDSSLKKLHETINNWIDERKKNDLAVTHPSEDGLLKEILDLFDGKTGTKYNEERAKQIIEEGKIRFEKKIPPGYKDSAKSARGDNSEYGDLFAWKEIIDYSKTNNKDIIYVTNDQKEDWWLIVSGKTLGPRVELRKEFSNETQKIFLLYTMENFIEHMNQDGASISKETIDEIKTNAPNSTQNNPEQTSFENKKEFLSKILWDLNPKIDYYSKSINHLQALKEQLYKEFNEKMSPEIPAQITKIEEKIKRHACELNRLYYERNVLSHDLRLLQ